MRIPPRINTLSPEGGSWDLLLTWTAVIWFRVVWLDCFYWPFNFLHWPESYRKKDLNFYQFSDLNVHLPILLPNVSFQEPVSGSGSQASKYGGALAAGTPRLAAHPPRHSQGLLWQVSLCLPLRFWRFCVLCGICPYTFMYWVNPEQHHSWSQSLTKWGLPGSISAFWYPETAWQVFESEILTQVSISDGTTGSGAVSAIGKLLLL